MGTENYMQKYKERSYNSNFKIGASTIVDDQYESANKRQIKLDSQRTNTLDAITLEKHNSSKFISTQRVNHSNVKFNQNERSNSYMGVNTTA